jgi:hypothetical protein
VSKALGVLRPAPCRQGWNKVPPTTRLSENSGIPHTALWGSFRFNLQERRQAVFSPLPACGERGRGRGASASTQREAGPSAGLGSPPTVPCGVFPPRVRTRATLRRLFTLSTPVHRLGSRPKIAYRRGRKAWCVLRDPTTTSGPSFNIGGSRFQTHPAWRSPLDPDAQTSNHGLVVFRCGIL